MLKRIGDSDTFRTDTGGGPRTRTRELLEMVSVNLRRDVGHPLIPPTEEQVAKMIKRAKEWKDFRERYYMSQRQLAQVLGIGKSVVGRIENKQEKRPHPTTLRRFENLKQRYKLAARSPKLR